MEHGQGGMRGRARTGRGSRGTPSWTDSADPSALLGVVRLVRVPLHTHGHGSSTPGMEHGQGGMHGRARTGRGTPADRSWTAAQILRAHRRRPPRPRSIAHARSPTRSREQDPCHPARGQYFAPSVYSYGPSPTSWGPKLSGQPDGGFSQRFSRIASYIPNPNSRHGSA